MNNLPFADLSEKNMLDVFRVDCCNEPSTNYLETNNDQLISIDPDLHVYTDTVEKQCHNYDTSVDFKLKYGSQNSISFVHSNICSTEKKLGDFTYYLDNLDMPFTFIGICETWATQLNEDILNIPGYKHEHYIRSNKRGGGVSIYILNTIPYKTRKNISFSTHISESVFIEIDKSLFKSKRNVIIGEIYRPPSSDKKKFNTELEKLLNNIEKEKKYAFLMGDYNINTLNEMQESETLNQEFSNIFSSHYYHKLINLPTRERKNSSTLLDNIYTNIPDCYNTCTSGVLRFFTQSDHYPVFTIRKDVQSPKPKTHISKRCHSYKNIANFKKHMNSINWNHIYNSNTIKLQFECFINNVINIFKQSFPIESIKINYKNRNPWINKNLKNVIKIRDKLYLLSKQIPTQSNKDNYKKYKNMNLSNQRNAERNYYKEQFDLHKTDLKRSWNIIKSIINKEDNRRSAKDIVFLINNKYISDGKMIANTFNNYFVNVGSSLAKNIQTETDPLHYIESLEQYLYSTEQSYQLSQIQRLPPARGGTAQKR